MGDVYVFDLETDGFLEQGTKVHCLVAINTRTREVHRFSPNNIRSGLDFLEQADQLIAHNGMGFDYPFLRKVRPDIKLPPLLDTLLISRLIFADMRDVDQSRAAGSRNYELPKHLWGRHSLESWGYRLGEYKGDFDGGDWQTYTPEMLDYCEQDCWVTLDLYEMFQKKDYSKKSIQLEHDFAKIIHRQEQNGWAFDEQTAHSLWGDLCDKRLVIKQEMTQLFPGWWEDTKTPEFYEFEGIKAATKTALIPKVKQQRPELSKKHIGDNAVAGAVKKKHTPFNPGSRQHITKVFKEKYNWKPQQFTPSGEPKVDDKVLQSLDYPEAKVLAEYFLLDKRIGQIAEGNQAWLKLVRNGRIYGRVNTLGAVTGRCTHSNPNIAQVPAIGVPYGKECRGLFKPSDGMVLVGADASGLELRCLAHYMAHWDKGAYAKVLLEGDIHSVNQEAAGLPTRDNAKTFIYAFLYGAGDEKIGSIVGSGRGAGKLLKEKFLKTLPALDKLLSSVQNTAKRGYITGLDGRQLKIRSTHAALNTLLQSAGAIVMKKSLVLLDQYLQEKCNLLPGDDYEFVGNIHDEMQIECLPEHADLVGRMAVKSIQDAGIAFNFKCPLDGEYKAGDSWAATH